MSEQMTESDEAPEWYIDHFVPLGYTSDDLHETWAGMSQTTRRNYQWALTTTQPPAAPADDERQP